MSSSESMLMSKFMVYKQQAIVDKVLNDWNTSHFSGVNAALSEAAWQGFLAGLEAAKCINPVDTK